jgi:hypothetical protein
VTRTIGVSAMTHFEPADDSPMWSPLVIDPPGPEEARALSAATARLGEISALARAKLDAEIAERVAAARLHPDDVNAIACRVVKLIDLERLIGEVSKRTATLLGVAMTVDAPAADLPAAEVKP